MDRRDANQLSKFAKVEREVTTALADDLRTYAVKRWPTMNHEWRKAKLASLLGMKVRRVRSYWDAEETLSPRQSEVDAIAELIGSEREIEEANRDAFAALQERIARLEAIILAQEAQPHHGPLAGKGERSFGRRRTDVAGSAGRS